MCRGILEPDMVWFLLGTLGFQNEIKEWLDFGLNEVLCGLSRASSVLFPICNLRCDVQISQNALALFGTAAQSCQFDGVLDVLACGTAVSFWLPLLMTRLPDNMTLNGYKPLHSLLSLVPISYITVSLAFWRLHWAASHCFTPQPSTALNAEVHGAGAVNSFHHIWSSSCSWRVALGIGGLQENHSLGMFRA